MSLTVKRAYVILLDPLNKSLYLSLNDCSSNIIWKSTKIKIYGFMQNSHSVLI